MNLPLTSDALTIYLQDHFAGSTFGLELVRRARDQNAGTPFGDFLARLADEIAEDRTELAAIMERLGIGKDRLKVVGAWGAEKAGRLKLNGQLRGYSPLSRVLELEGLLAGVEGKLGLWRALGELAPSDSRLDEAEIEMLAKRAQGQIRGLRAHHKRAAREAFAPL
jgi:hypothetical protein